MQIHKLKKNTKRAKSTRVGRGGRRGKTSGRGHKGQNARAGSSTRPGLRDEIKRVPKRRGHGKNRARTVNSSKIKPTTVDLSFIEEVISKGVKVVSPSSLVKGGFVKKVKGQTPSVKVLGTGEIKSKANLKSILVSQIAQEKIEKAGGKIS